MFKGAPPRFDHGIREFQPCESQDAAQDARRNEIVDFGIHVLYPASANTTGTVSAPVAPRLASSSTARLLTGANVSATRHARIRREKLSITACR
jgi:hypothetical protein